MPSNDRLARRLHQQDATASVFVVVLLITVASARMAAADTLIGTFSVSYRYNASGCAPDQPHPFHCNYEAGPVPVNPDMTPPGDYRVVLVAPLDPAYLLGGFRVWDGDATAGTQYESGVVFHHTSGQIYLYFHDWYIFDNPPTSGWVVNVFRIDDGIAAPTNLRATQAGFTGRDIHLTWEYGSDAVDGFTIQRQSPYQRRSGEWTDLPFHPAPGDRAYEDDPVPVAYGTYTYRITANRGPDTSTSSDESTAFQISLYSAPCTLDPSTHEPSCQLTEMPLTPGKRGGQLILAHFEPDPVVPVMEVARQHEFDHFNWVSVVNHDPVAGLGLLIDRQGREVRVPYLDPPPGGYSDRLSDSLPFYWDEILGLDDDRYYLFVDAAGGDQHSALGATFADIPSSSALGVGQHIGFFTTLVGVNTRIPLDPSTPARYAVLASFGWNTNFNQVSGGVERRVNLDAPTAEATGGIFNAAVLEPEFLPVNIRELLIAEGAQGISDTPHADVTPPRTASFLSGPRGADPFGYWYHGAVRVTLIATDNEGPENVATWYRVDGGPLQAYTGPFDVTGQGPSGLGGHFLVFWSEDRAGNVEPFVVGVNGIGFGIDLTPPTITRTGRTPPNSSGWNKSVVSVRFVCTEDLSGLAEGSRGTIRFLVTTEGERQSVTGTCTDLAGNSSSLTVSDINIDSTPPTIGATRSPAANQMGWNNTPVTIAFTCSDTLSGIAAGDPSSVTVSSQGADQSVSSACVDRADNSATLIVGGINIDTKAARLSVSASTQTLWPPNGQLVTDVVTGMMQDELSGFDAATLRFAVLDEYGSVQPAASIVPAADGHFSFLLSLQASRNGNDKDGRRYSIVVTGSDLAGNPVSASAIVLVPHDQGKR